MQVKHNIFRLFQICFIDITCYVFTNGSFPGTIRGRSNTVASGNLLAIVNIKCPSLIRCWRFCGGGCIKRGFVECDFGFCSKFLCRVPSGCGAVGRSSAGGRGLFPYSCPPGGSFSGIQYSLPAPAGKIKAGILSRRVENRPRICYNISCDSI